MSTTPRTDTAICGKELQSEFAPAEVVDAAFARTLERELTEKIVNEQAYEHILGPRSYQEVADELAAAKRDAERYQELLNDPETGRHLLSLLTKEPRKQAEFRRMQDRIKASKDAALAAKGE